MSEKNKNKKAKEEKEDVKAVVYTKLTYLQIESGYGALLSIANGNRCGMQLQWDIDDILAVIERPFKRYSKTKDALATKHGDEIKETPGRFKIREDEDEEYNEKLTALNEMTIELPIKKLDFKDIAGAGITITGREMRPLKGLFVTRDGAEDVPEPTDYESVEELEIELPEKEDKPKSEAVPMAPAKGGGGKGDLEKKGPQDTESKDLKETEDKTNSEPAKDEIPTPLPVKKEETVKN